MKRSKEKLKNRKQNNSNKNTALKVLAASTLGLSILMSAPHVPDLMRYASVGVYNQDVSEYLYKSSANTLSSTSTGSTFDNSVVTGTGSGDIATGTGVTGDYTGSTLNESSLPSASTVTGNWNDSFEGKTYAELLALERDDGNILKSKGTEGEEDYRAAYTIYDANEFAFFSALVKANYTCNEIKNQTFKLGADIDLKGKAWKPVYDLDNNSTNIVNFDGAGYTISNAYVYDARNADGTNTKTYASIFGNWGVGYIKNLIIENANIQSWRSAAVVSNKRTDYSYASDYENITLKNCKVVAGSCGDSVHIYAVGISTNARYMTDCYMEGCEIIGTDTDVNLIGQELVNNVLNLSNTYHHVYGFGRARKVTNSNPEEKTVGIKNCKIAFESNAQNYDALTRSTSKYVYVCGISNFDQSVDDATYSNITVDNCEIYSDAKIGDATSASDALRYQNLNAYVYGVSKYGSSSTSIAVTLLDINVKNSKVYSSFDYSPTSENNKDMYFNFGTHVNGVSEVYTGNPAEGSTLYKNIVVENCDIYSSGDAEVITPQTNRRTNSYDTYNMNGRVSGLTSIETNSSKLENCSVKNCNVTASNKFKAVDDANYYINSSTDAYGMCISPNGRAADFVDCIVDNCNIFADSDLDNGTFAGDTDYHNPINQNTYAAGMGKGSFKSSKVTNCNIYTKSYDTKDTTVDKVGGWSGSTNAIGLGITRGDKSASVVDAVVDNCNITAESVHGSAIATGLTRQVNGGAYGFTITNSKLTNSTITAVSLKGNSHCTGLSLNDQTHTQGDASINITENTIDNVKMNFELTRVGGSGTETISAGGNTYGVAGLYNNSTVNNGITYNKNSFKNLSLDVNKLTGESYLTGGLYNTGAAKIAVSDNTVIDSAIHNKVTNATNNSHAYLSGLVYTTATKTTNDLTYIENNVCDNLDISNVVEGKTNIGHVLYTSGMIFVGGNTSAVIKSTNNVVKNSTIDTTSNVGNVYSFGMMALTYNRPTELSDEVRSEAYECYAYNNNVIANFNRGGSNATDKGAYAFGLTGWYVSRVRNCVVGSGSVNAHNDMTTAAACGVAATRGFGNGYSNRYNNTADNVYYTEIDNCYNFAEVKAETESSSQVSYAAGIGRAEIFTNCANYGNVTGNYAGGITTGYYVGGTSSTNVQSSFGLTIKNCVNAGNVCRANGGGQSFIGGIVARYEMRYYALHKFVLENNVSIGGVYSGYNETTGEYSQTLTSSTFMGMLYGQLSLPTDTSNYSIIDSVLDTISIRNNYMLVEEDGMNSGLYYAPNSSLDNLPVLIDTPHSPHIAATEGIFYQHQGNYKLDGTNNTYVYNKDRYKVMYSRCMGIDDTANSNTLIGTDYTAETFAKNSKYDTYYTEGDWLEWTMPSGRVPQVATTLEKLIVRYDIGDYVGTTPNVDIVDKTDTGYSYTLSNGRVGDDSSASIIDQVGVSLSQWAYDGVQYAPSYEVSNVAINGIVTYDAVVDYTNYYLELVNNNSDITISGVDGQVSLETTTKEITATGSDSLSVTAFMLQVKNADEWETLQVLPAQERQATFN
ncbi:MAG: hypothetical protein ACI4PF_00630, partial [Christensenellales bacterium]